MLQPPKLNLEFNSLSSLIDTNTVLGFGGIKYINTTPHGFKKHCRKKATNTL